MREEGMGRRDHDGGGGGGVWGGETMMGGGGVWGGETMMGGGYGEERP